MMETVLLAAGILAMLGFIWMFFSRPQQTSVKTSAQVIPSGVTVTSAPLLTETDIVLYNVLRLAVQDHYLVFAQVPLWTFVSVEAIGKARFQVLNRIALKRVDFVLVHPGSRHVEQVVQIEEASPRPHQLERQHVIESVLHAAGIKLVKVRPQKSYTVPDLSTLLGLESQE